MPTTASINALYATLLAHPTEPRLPSIRPFIGSDYDAPEPDRLRVLAIGLNAYISDEHRPAESTWFRCWVAERRSPFFRTAVRECERLAHGMLQQLDPPSLSFDATTGLYLTNAVKRYLPYASGRHVGGVDPRWFHEGRGIWLDELRTLAQADALPHVVVVFGRDAWPHVHEPLQQLCADATASAFVAYRPRDEASPLFHRLNVIDVRQGGAVRSMLLVRLNHPASPSRFNASALLASDEFCGVVPCMVAARGELDGVPASATVAESSLPDLSLLGDARLLGIAWSPDGHDVTLRLSVPGVPRVERELRCAGAFDVDISLSFGDLVRHALVWEASAEPIDRGGGVVVRLDFAGTPDGAIKISCARCALVAPVR